MPSQAMQDVIDAFRDRQKASASQAPPTLEERRATFAPAGRLHPVPDDVLVTDVTAGGVPAHWLAAPGADTGRVLLFLHGGGYELGSLRSDGELAARLIMIINHTDCGMLRFTDLLPDPELVDQDAP
jgi:epsilon-lactone hydrolase